MIYIKAKLTTYTKQKTQYVLKFSTKENIDDVILEQSLKTEGYLLFAPDEIKRNVEEAIKNKRLGANYEHRSKSSILRGKLYEIWYNKQSSKDWETFYAESMDFITNHFIKKHL